MISHFSELFVIIIFQDIILTSSIL